jgi:hypothetical protein
VSRKILQRDSSSASLKHRQDAPAASQKQLKNAFLDEKHQLSTVVDKTVDSG